MSLAKFVTDMKKKNWFFKLGLSAVLLAISFVAATASCSTKSSKPQKAKKASKMTYANTTFDNAVGDSIQTIMMSSKVVAMLTTTDSLKAQPIQLALSREDTQVLRFLVSDPKMFIENVQSYGVVMPQVRFLFEKSKSEKVEVGLDFGLRKWILADGTGKVVKQYALAKNDFLRFSHSLFPNDELITNLYNSSKK